MITNADTIDASNAVIILPCEEGVAAHVVCYPDGWIGTVLTTKHILQVFSIDAARTVVSYFRGKIPRHYLDHESISILQLELSVREHGRIHKQWNQCHEELPEIMHDPSEQIVKWMSMQEVIKI